MIIPQYTYDHSGNKVGVFLPIEDWNELNEVSGVKEISQTEATVPDWQIELGKEELTKLANGTADLMDWGKAKRTLNI